jgi:hypothetical protein
MSRIGVCAIGLALGWCSIAMAANWEQLQQLHPGDKIRVELEGKGGMTADFAGVTAEGLQLVRHQEQRELPRPEIRRVWVYRATGRSRVRAAAPWIGAGVGFGAGFGIGAGATAGCRSFCFVSAPTTGAIIGVVGAGAGALVGYLASGKSETRTLVYQR